MGECKLPLSISKRFDYNTPMDTSIDSQIFSTFTAVWEKACGLFPGLRMHAVKLNIQTPSNARIAGSANSKTLVVTINPEHARINLAECLTNTIPHEIAHIVQFIVYPNAKQAHGKEWRRICLYLGGDGRRCYNIEDYAGLQVKTRKVKRWVYTRADGDTVRLTKSQHEKFQLGRISVRSRTTHNNFLYTDFTGDTVLIER
jgi:predicted SprT family Zn-dependent metalloprotease